LESKEQLLSVIDVVSKTEKKIRDTMKECFRHLDSREPAFVRKINLLSLLCKVLEVNSNFLQTSVNIYNQEEPVISTALARGIFELHLILLEATSGDENFLGVLNKCGDAYESHIQMFGRLAKEKGDTNAINIFNREMKRIYSLRQRFEKLLDAELKHKKKLQPYVKFAGLAKKYGLSDVYEIEYSLLSSFIHPTFLYLITTRPTDRTVSERKRKLALWNITYRKQMVKKVATKLAAEFSLRTIAHIEKTITNLQL